MERIEELTLLNEIGAAVSSTLDVDEILQYVMRKVEQVMQVEACSLMLYDPAENVLRFKVSFGTGSDKARTMSFPADQGLAGWMLQNRQPLLVPDVQADPRFYQDIDHNTGLTTRNMVGAPLMVKGRVIGVLEAINALRSPFSEADLRLLTLIAVPVAQAVENARLFDEVHRSYREQMEQKRQIEESRNMLQAIFDGISDVLLILDRDLNVVSANPAASALTERDATELIGRPIDEVLAGNPRAWLDGSAIRRTLRSGQPAHDLLTFPTSSDTARQWNIRTYPLRDAGGDVSRVIVFGHDVTEQRQLEAAVARTAKLAALGKLAAGTAHELGNPLTTIMGNAALLQRKSEEGSLTRELSDAIAEASQRARGVLRALLDYSRQEQYEFSSVDVHDTIEWSLALLRYTFVEGEISLRKELDPEVPRITASENHMRTLWTNLLLNATDAVQSRKGQEGFKGEVEVSTTWLAAAQQVQIIVRDNGVGIPEKLMARLFEPFFTTKGRGSGTGLGLYISASIVEQHGGQIHVMSAEGKGTTFTVLLPVKPQ